MSKRSGSSIPSTEEKAKTRRRFDSHVSKSDSSSDPPDESEHDLLAPVVGSLCRVFVSATK